ncbi:MAG TPA: VanZ family protein [Chitinophagaceae bacterium]|nr:VanZ family protein [Chitinophagaceae bacterium]
MIKRIISHLFFPLALTIAIQVLLCLPGSALPSESLFDIPHFDKFVHIFLFGAVTGLWCYYYYAKGTSATRLKTIFFIIYLLVAFNGILLEFIQRDYIPNRSFDQGDIIADLLASSIAYGICSIRLISTQ